jgi:predicted dehydrogenase
MQAAILVAPGGHGDFAVHSLTREYLQALLTLSDGVEVAGLVGGDAAPGSALVSLAAEYNVRYIAVPDALGLPREQRAGLPQGLDAVIVCGTIQQRPALIQQALALASHILCPVPFGPTVADAEQCVSGAAEKGGHVHPALTLRYVPVLQSLKSMIEQGTLGQLLSLKLQHQARRMAIPVRDLMLQNILHAVDLVRWLCTSDIVETYAEVGTGLVQADTSVVDVTALSVVLANGAYATLDTSLSLPGSHPAPEELQIEVIGTGGWARVDAYRQRIDTYAATGVAWAEWGSRPVTALVEAFVGSVKRNLPDRASWDAVQAQAIAQFAVDVPGGHGAFVPGGHGSRG